MKIGIIGAGFTGLTAAYQLLQQGHQVIIFEREEDPGGLALGFTEKGWDWTLEQYYHHWFTGDKYILNLAKELNFPVIIKRPKTSAYVDGHIYQIDSPAKLLQFAKLSLPERIRMGAGLALLRYNPYWKSLEKFAASDILPSLLGNRAYNMLWKPQLHNKFGQYLDSISLAWFWARIRARTTSLAYPEGGFLRFAQELAKKIEDMGGKIMYKTSVDLIRNDAHAISLGKLGNFDKVLVTLPSFFFLKLCPQLPDEYKKQLEQLQGLGAVVMILRLKQQFMRDGTYWLSVCDTQSPVLAIVEHTNFMDASHYNDEHLVYLGNYLPHYHPYFKTPKHQLLKTFDPFLKKINPDYGKHLIGTELFTVPFAQPIIPVNYSKMIPAFETPLKNVYLANMQQVYPWDRGTNYAVELGEKVAREMTQS